MEQHLSPDWDNETLAILFGQTMMLDGRGVFAATEHQLLSMQFYEDQRKQKSLFISRRKEEVWYLD